MKIIYNTKLKKLFVSCIIFMLLFGYLMPIRVYAASSASAQDLYNLMQQISYDYRDNGVR